MGKTRTSEGRAVASVQPLQSETFKSEPADFDPAPPVKTKEKEDSKEFDIRVTNVIDVEHFWAQLGETIVNSSASPMRWRMRDKSEVKNRTCSNKLWTKEN